MKLKQYALELKREIITDRVPAYAAQAAYFMVLSFIPFLIVFSSLLKFSPVTEGDVLMLVNENVPSYLKAVIVFLVDEVYNNSPQSISITVLIAVWSASKGIQYLSAGLNQIHGIKETRPWLFLKARAIGYTLVFTLILEALLTLVVFAGKLADFLMGSIPAAEPVIRFLMQFRFLIVGISLVFFLTLAYRALPNTRGNFKDHLWGAAICSVSWFFFSFGLSVYVNLFHGFSMYGSLMTIVLLLFWLYVCLFLFLVCGEIGCPKKNLKF